MINFKLIETEDLQRLIKNATDELVDRLEESEHPFKDKIRMKTTEEMVMSSCSERKKLIKEAEELIENLKDSNGDYRVVGGSCIAQFKVNRNKRTVTCSLIGVYTGYKRKRAVAIYHPDDVFNSTLGKLVSLMKCLEKEVPSKFLNAPQPTKVEAGMIVRNKNSYPYKEFKVYRVGFDTVEDNYGKPYLISDVKIIDDSEALTDNK